MSTQQDATPCDEESWPEILDHEASALDAPGKAPESPTKGVYSPRLRMVGDYQDDALAEHARRHHAAANGLALGPRVFLPRLAREIGGDLPQGVVVIGGSPGAGKTALAHEIAANAGCASVIVSMEMSPYVLIDRHIARHKKVWLNRLRCSNGTSNENLIAPEQWEQFFIETSEAMKHVGIIDGTRSGVGRKTIKTSAEIARNESGGEHLLIVIDSFHSWMRCYQPEGKQNAKSDDRGNMERALHGLGQLASEEKATVLLITEQSKAAMDSDSQAASADSRVFAYISELVLMLTRDWEMPEDSDGEVPILLTIGKNRHGSPGGKINLQFCGGKMRFRENPLGGRVVESAKKKGPK